MRIVSIGDIGVIDDVIHIGDEAMFHELVVQLRERGADAVTGISSNPAESAARYGIDSVHRIGFPFGLDFTREDAIDRMDRVIRSAAGEAGLLRDDDTAWAVIEAVRAADGVAIAGGGNIMSNWPTHIFERGTLGEIARVTGTPLVISGQTIGPYLTADDEVLVTRLLTRAALVGVRESHSYDYALRFGVDPAKLQLTVDDASFLGYDAPASTAVGEPYCAVTLSSHLNGEDPEVFDRRTAELLDGIAKRTGLTIAFFAHFGSFHSDISYGDTRVHDRVRAHMTTPNVSVVTTSDSISAAQFSRGASLVVSSRYHPAVFAVSAGVPTVGVPVDDYTTAKLTGALGNFGQDGILPLADLLAGDGSAAVDRVWAARDAVAAERAATIAANRASSSAWWDRVAAVVAPR